MNPILPKIPDRFPEFTSSDELTMIVSEMTKFILACSNNKENDYASKVVDICLHELGRRSTEALSQIIKKNSKISSRQNWMMIVLTVAIFLLTWMLFMTTIPSA